MEKLFKDIIDVYGVSGREAKIRRFLSNEIKDLGYDILEDKMGNLIVRINKEDKNKNNFMISAHMDTIGVISTYIEEDGKIRIGSIGDFHVKEMCNTIVVFENGTLGRTSIDKDGEKIEDMFIDIGSDNREEVLKSVKEGDVAFFKGETLNQDTLLLSPNLNNRVGCYVLLKTLKEIAEDNEVKERLNKLENNIYLVFTTQHNLNSRGARATTHSVNPQKALVIDVEEGLKLGEEIGIKIMDKNLIIHDEIRDMVEDAAKRNNIKLKGITSKTQSDGGAIQLNGLGAKVGVVTIPCKYKNTNEEMISMTDVENLIKLVKDIILNS